MSSRPEPLNPAPAGAPEKFVSREERLMEVVVDYEELFNVIVELKDGGRASAGLIALVTQDLDHVRKIARTAICAASRFCMSDSFVFRSHADAVVVTRATDEDSASAGEARVAAAVN